MRVLLIDDAARLAELLEGYLAPQGVTMVHAGGGQAGLGALAGGGFDAVFLDVMMPGLDGLTVLRKIREAGHRVPVLMLTARGDEADRVVGLELGADDYIAKPFSPRELLARLRAVLRRAQPDAVAEKLTASGIAVDTSAREAWVDGKPVVLTGLEIDLLTVLLRRAGRVVPRSALMARVVAVAREAPVAPVDRVAAVVLASLGTQSLPAVAPEAELVRVLVRERV